MQRDCSRPETHRHKQAGRSGVTKAAGSGAVWPSGVAGIRVERHSYQMRGLVNFRREMGPQAVTMPGRADGSSQATWRWSNGVESSGRGHPQQQGRQRLPIFRRELRRAIALSKERPLGHEAVYQYCGEGLNVGDRDISPAAQYCVYKSVTERSELSAKNANKLNKERHVSLVTIVRFRR